MRLLAAAWLAERLGRQHAGDVKHGGRGAEGGRRAQAAWVGRGDAELERGGSALGDEAEEGVEKAKRVAGDGFANLGGELAGGGGEGRYEELSAQGPGGGLGVGWFQSLEEDVALVGRLALEVQLTRGEGALGEDDVALRVTREIALGGEGGGPGGDCGAKVFAARGRGLQSAAVKPLIPEEEGAFLGADQDTQRGDALRTPPGMPVQRVQECGVRR